MQASLPRVQALYLQAPAGPMFALHHAPAPAGVTPRAAVVFVHALAEEMNKSRRMAALQARALAQAGVAVLQPDLHGCGDSSGDFVDARWPLWLQDVACALAWLQAQHPGAPLWLWGHRAGALLAAQALHAAHGGSAVAGLLLWQPLARGDDALRPWRRMQQVAGLLAGRPPAASLAPATGSGAAATGPGMQAAGYAFHAELLHALQGVQLTPPPAAALQPARPTIWLDLHDPGLPAPTVAPAAAAAWAAAGPLHHASLPGPAFWRSTDIDEVPALIDATTRALLQACPPRHA